MIIQELVVKYKTTTKKKLDKVSDPKNVANFFRHFLKQESVEYLYALFLDNGNNIIGYYLISKGTTNSSFASPKEVFKVALLCNASSLILCHNHPSGALDVSESDINITKIINNAGKLLDMQLIDHVIVTDDSYISFQAEGLI